RARRRSARLRAGGLTRGLRGRPRPPLRHARVPLRGRRRARSARGRPRPLSLRRHPAAGTAFARAASLAARRDLPRRHALALRAEGVAGGAEAPVLARLVGDRRRTPAREGDVAVLPDDGPSLTRLGRRAARSSAKTTWVNSCVNAAPWFGSPPPPISSPPRLHPHRRRAQLLPRGGFRPGPIGQRREPGWLWRSVRYGTVTRAGLASMRASGSPARPSSASGPRPGPPRGRGGGQSAGWREP